MLTPRTDPHVGIGERALSEISRLRRISSRSGLQWYRRFVRSYANPIPIMLARLGWGTFPRPARLRAGQEVILQSYRDAEFYACSEIRGGPTSSAIRVNVDGRELVLESGWQYGDIMAVYVDRIYQWLPVAGRVVLDIGASIGDSAMYFFARGARRVLAVEPWPKNYRLLERNVRLNDADDVVTPVNAGLAGSCGTVRLKEGAEDSLENHLEDSPEGTPVALITLKDIVDRFQIDSAVLKLDCEGAEYEILSKTDDKILRRFSHIQLEYHYGRSPLVAKLQDLGYRVKSTIPIIRYNWELNRPVMRMGDLWASLPT